MNAPAAFPEKRGVIGPLTVSDLTVDGKGIARHEGRVVFLDGGLPGDKVTAAVTDVKRNALRASVVETLFASPYTVAPFCLHAGECGGCSLQHFEYAAALAWKRRHIAGCLSRIGRIESPEVAELVPSPELRAWRNKIACSFAPAQGDEGGPPLLGLRVCAGKTVVPVTDCAAQSAEAVRLTAYVRARAHALGLPAWDGRIAAPGRQPRDASGKKHPRPDAARGYLRSLVVHSPDYAPDGVCRLLVEIIIGPEHSVRGENGPAGAGGLPGGVGRTAGLSRSEKIRMLGGELLERFRAAGFIHSERARLSDIAEGERRVYAAGSEHRLERFGKITVKAPYNAFLQTNTQCAAKLFELAAVIVADPPRAGLHAEAIRLLIEVPAERLIYVSCDASRQARDAALLSPLWRAVKSLPVDMFPFTPHVENLLVMERRGI
ncbi:MAG: TRAM domain-containing protein [Desulfovibrio sp.]|nr:TRAM domain-containing protein [Desulfovibrio sp.]